jgi:hypothetical protein
MGMTGKPIWQMSSGHTEVHPRQQQVLRPFSLVYGTDTISPTELVVPSPRVMQGSELEVDANICAEARMADLEGLDEARDLAKAKSQRNYQKMANVYSKALRVRIFAEGQMVLKAAEFVRRNLPSPSKFSLIGMDHTLSEKHMEVVTTGCLSLMGLP